MPKEYEDQVQVNAQRGAQALFGMMNKKKDDGQESKNYVMIGGGALLQGLGNVISLAFKKGKKSESKEVYNEPVKLKRPIKIGGLEVYD